MFEYHTYLHHSQTVVGYSGGMVGFEYHTYLHHSQTNWPNSHWPGCLNTIHIYIILKLVYWEDPPESVWIPYIFTSFSNSTRKGAFKSWSLNTIHIYIILKQVPDPRKNDFRLNTIHIYIILKPQIQKWNAIISINTGIQTTKSKDFAIILINYILFYFFLNAPLPILN